MSLRPIDCGLIPALGSGGKCARLLNDTEEIFEFTRGTGNFVDLAPKITIWWRKY